MFIVCPTSRARPDIYRARLNGGFLSYDVASFIKEVNPRLAERPLKTNGRLADRGLTSLVKGWLTLAQDRPLRCTDAVPGWERIPELVPTRGGLLETIEYVNRHCLDGTTNVMYDMYRIYMIYVYRCRCSCLFFFFFFDQNTSSNWHV